MFHWNRAPERRDTQSILSGNFPKVVIFELPHDIHNRSLATINSGVGSDMSIRLYLPFLMSALLALVMFVGFSAYDILILEQRPHAEGPPIFDWYHIIRLLASIAGSLFIVRCFPVGGLTTPSDMSNRIGPLSALLLWVTTLIFIASPELYSTLGREDGVIEWASAILVFLSCLLFVLTAVRLRKTRLSSAKLASSIAIALAVLLFVLGMEEISWMQRVFDFQTPDAFPQNGQGEFNLHNFQTNKIENLYYIGAFCLLFLFPYLLTAVRPKMPMVIQAIAPSHKVALACAPMAALNWDMWNIIPIQMMFWITVFCLVVLTKDLHRHKSPLSRSYGFVLLTVFAAQMVFLLIGDTFIRQWDVTEYKELFISIGFFVYAIEAWSTCPSPLPVSKNIPAGGK